MIRDFRDYLDDMLEHAEKARAFVGTMTWGEFQADEKTRFATVRAIEIIGPAQGSSNSYRRRLNASIERRRLNP